MFSKYHKGDYIKIMTNKPVFHLNEMFGYNDLQESDFEKTEYTAFIKSVIDESTYLVFTVSPKKGFRCIVDIADIIRLVFKSELTQKELEFKESEDFIAPNVYHHTKILTKKTLESKCKYLAKEAMTALFPEEEIASLNLTHSYYLKSDIIKRIDFFLEKFCRIARQDLIDEKTGKRDMLEKMLAELKFKEYYSIMVGCFEDDEHTIVGYHTIVVSTNFDEACVIRNPEEKSRFENSLGPDFDIISKTFDKLLSELRW